MNTKFFHNMASARKRANKIAKLRRDDGTWAVDVADIHQVVKNYFCTIFPSNGF